MECVPSGGVDYTSWVAHQKGLDRTFQSNANAHKDTGRGVALDHFRIHSIVLLSSLSPTCKWSVPWAFGATRGMRLDASAELHANAAVTGGGTVLTAISWGSSGPREWAPPAPRSLSPRPRYSQARTATCDRRSSPDPMRHGDSGTYSAALHVPSTHRQHLASSYNVSVCALSAHSTSLTLTSRPRTTSASPSPAVL